MSKKLLGKVFGLTIAVGTVFAVVKFIEWLDKQGEDYVLTEFSELVKNQKTVEELDVTVITDWINNIKNEHPEGLSYIISYPTDEATKKFHLTNFPENMDYKHNIILFAFNKETYRPVKVQMISFGTIDKKLEFELFKNNYYAVVEE